MGLTGFNVGPAFTSPAHTIDLIPDVFRMLSARNPTKLVLHKLLEEMFLRYYMHSGVEKISIQNHIQIIITRCFGINFLQL